ncbi:hypothetical protein [Exiguobacterium sp. S22-S28]|uniref:hypothetical protein n=1 Tax=Exiguobacterium sp. S22-S28 TaxID=3342768 RepID=UPI00372D5E07
MKKSMQGRVTAVLTMGFLATSILMPSKGDAASPFKERDARTYDDYKDQYAWSDAMRSFVAAGQVNTYTTHPQTKKKGHWLDPDGGLTEGQLLYTLTQYAYPKEYKRTKPEPGVDYSVAYQLADEHKLATRATHDKDRSLASKTVTRGQFARILASVYYARQVSDKDAVAFMYETGLSRGEKGRDGRYARTYRSFGPDVRISRGSGLEMLMDYKRIRANRTFTPNFKPVYGDHTYGARTKLEYDMVMGVARKALFGVEDGPYSNSPISQKAYSDYLDGGTKPITDRSNPEFRSSYNAALLYAHNNLNFYKESGMSKADIIKYWRVKSVFANLDTGIDPKDGSPNSAYDALFRGVTDCDADSQVMIMVLDMMGYNTAILGRPGHAFTVVKLADAWRDTTTFEKVNMSPYIKGTKGLDVVVAPTKGY